MAKLLIIAPQGLGDALQITPALPALHQMYPNLVVDVVTLRPTTTFLFEGLCHLVDRVVELPYWNAGRIAFTLALLRFLATQRYNASILAYPAARWEYNLLHALIRSKRRVAHQYGSRFVLDGVPGFRAARVDACASTNVERNAHLFLAAGYPSSLAPMYQIPKRWRANTLATTSYTVIHVGSISHDTFAAKRWPLEYFIDLATRLLKRGERVIYLSGPDELAETRAAHMATPGSDIFQGSLEETCMLLDGSALVVTNDTGIGHLTAGLGRPVLALFGPTSLEYAPYGNTTTALRPSLCPPCFDVLQSDMSCKLRIDYACLRRDLTVELVEREAVGLLTKHRTVA